MLKKLYDWVIEKSASKTAFLWLFAIAFMESSFFPVPPDLILISILIADSKKWMKAFFLCLAGSVLGGVFGYAIGFYFFDVIGKKIIDIYNLWNAFEKVSSFYRENSLLIVFTGAFTPVPYKVITITAGFFSVDVLKFIAVSFAGRGGRFFIVSLLLRLSGERIKIFIDRYFNLLTIVFTLLLIGGFLFIKFL